MCKTKSFNVNMKMIYLLTVITSVSGTIHQEDVRQVVDQVNHEASGGAVHWVVVGSVDVTYTLGSFFKHAFAK